ncbi:hypothetical protein JHS3_24580 [Jeongeupia sp. HS-3]|uniref:nucleotidyltransferase family protein n=1 Tax=Jeongeupia sp. HS-3 TaxID=1009682 RepID=UPI0018A557E0|nr:nucleotidyltransferase domain-containing protein [Jeongeupia sp. HS-3]BCL76722.1 hypothetical protein JHS3_24580 [Jeongeupia sp. HS-3]
MTVPIGLDLSPEQWQIIYRILAQHLPDRKVCVFGSRVRGTARPFSDLDLAIMGDEALPLSALATLNEAFTESPLPFKVDLLDWADASPRFRDSIRADLLPITDEIPGD